MNKEQESVKTKKPQRNHILEDALKINQEVICGFAMTRFLPLNSHLFCCQFFSIAISYISVLNFIICFLMSRFIKWGIQGSYIKNIEEKKVIHLSTLGLPSKCSIFSPDTQKELMNCNQALHKPCRCQEITLLHSWSLNLIELFLLSSSWIMSFKHE